MEKFLDIILGIVIAISAALVLVPIVSYILTAIGLQGIAGGPILRVLAIVITLITVLVLTLKWQQPDKKWLLLFYVLLLGAGFFVIYKMPEWLPQFFSSVSTGVTPSVFSLSPTMSAIVGLGLLGALYWYSKKR
jgi:hypothetical protein